MEHELYECDSFKTVVTVEDGLPFIHIDLYEKLTPGRLKLMQEVFKETCQFLDAMGVVTLFALTPNPAFGRRFFKRGLTQHESFQGRPLLSWDIQEFLYGN